MLGAMILKDAHVSAIKELEAKESIKKQIWNTFMSREHFLCNHSFGTIVQSDHPKTSDPEAAARSKYPGLHLRFSFSFVKTPLNILNSALILPQSKHSFFLKQNAQGLH
jgi:hypothetical protein